MNMFEVVRTCTAIRNFLDGEPRPTICAACERIVGALQLHHLDGRHFVSCLKKLSLTRLRSTACLRFLELLAEGHVPDRLSGDEIVAVCDTIVGTLGLEFVEANERVVIKALLTMSRVLRRFPQSADEVVVASLTRAFASWVTICPSSGEAYSHEIQQAVDLVGALGSQLCTTDSMMAPFIKSVSKIAQKFNLVRTVRTFAGKVLARLDQLNMHAAAELLQGFTMLMCPGGDAAPRVSSNQSNTVIPEVERVTTHLTLKLSSPNSLAALSAHDSVVTLWAVSLLQVSHPPPTDVYLQAMAGCLEKIRQMLLEHKTFRRRDAILLVSCLYRCMLVTKTKLSTDLASKLHALLDPVKVGACYTFAEMRSQLSATEWEFLFSSLAGMTRAGSQPITGIAPLWAHVACNVLSSASNRRVLSLFKSFVECNIQAPPESLPHTASAVRRILREGPSLRDATALFRIVINAQYKTRMSFLAQDVAFEAVVSTLSAMLNASPPLAPHLVSWLADTLVKLSLRNMRSRSGPHELLDVRRILAQKGSNESTLGWSLVANVDRVLSSFTKPDEGGKGDDTSLPATDTQDLSTLMNSLPLLSELLDEGSKDKLRQSMQKLISSLASLSLLPEQVASFLQSAQRLGIDASAVFS